MPHTKGISSVPKTTGEIRTRDVGFREDQSHATQGYCAENLAVIRHLAVNLIVQEQSAKGSTRAKLLKAGWDDSVSHQDFGSSAYSFS